MNGFHQKIDHAVDDLRFPYHQEDCIETQLPPRSVAAHLRSLFAADPPNNLIDPRFAGARQHVPRQIQLLDESQSVGKGKHVLHCRCTRITLDRMESDRSFRLGE